MTRIGLITDIHAGFHRYSRTNAKGVNQREADLYRAAINGVENLLDAGVEAIVDLGDLADTPQPRKRALHFLVELINTAGIPFYSVNGNHTLIRRSGDIHLYEYLERYCPTFRGFTEATFVEELGALLVPYGTSEEIKAGLALAEKHDVRWVGGHWATEDVLPDGHDVKLADLPDLPILLGHFHTRALNEKRDHLIAYIGATERKSWGEATNSTGVAVLSDDAQTLTFIDHPAREWVDLKATAEDYRDVLRAGNLVDKIVRLTVDATPEEYRTVDQVAARRIASGALDFTVRRARTKVSADVGTVTPSFSLMEDWRAQVKGARVPRGITKGAVREAGEAALAAAGVAA